MYVGAPRGARPSNGSGLDFWSLRDSFLARMAHDESCVDLVESCDKRSWSRPGVRRDTLGLRSRGGAGLLVMTHHHLCWTSCQQR